MSAKVSVPSILRALTDQNKTIQVNGSTLGEVIEDIERNYPGMKERLMTEGKLYRYMNVFINDDDARFAGEINASVKDGDLITILPAVAGGKY